MKCSIYNQLNEYPAIELAIELIYRISDYKCACVHKCLYYYQHHYYHDIMHLPL